MKDYEIANELGVDVSTLSRDMQFLISQLHKYLNRLAKEALPFMYQTSIEGIRNVLKECWNIYTNESNNDINRDITGFHKPYQQYYELSESTADNIIHPAKQKHLPSN